ncbi:MAG TPA: ADP-ribosylglycohydrolase family protein, partial [Anaerolineales bacterium]
MPEEFISPLSRSRFRGCLLGLAVGDALGTSVEFMPPGSFTPLTDMVGGGKFNLAPGEWTDDTSMALCLAESLVEKQAFNPVDQLERYLRWYRTGYLSANGRCFDIGIATCNALHRFERNHEPYPGSTAPHTAGCGSLMRLAPIPMFYANDITLAIARSADSSRTTHANSKAVDACRYFGAVLVGALNGYSKDELLSPSALKVFQRLEVDTMLQDMEASISEVAGGSFKHRLPPEI